jgi:YD repeat-containing protein
MALSSRVRTAFLITAFISGSATALAQTPFSHEGFDGVHPPSSSIPTEQVDPASGTLSVVETDLALPGNAGFDLVIQRVYNSAVYPNYATGGDQSLEEDSWAGIGWRLHFGRILHADSQSAGQIAVEMGDGSRHPFYHSLANPNIWTTTDFWLYNPTDHTLKTPDGRVYTFNRDVNLGGSLGDTRYVTQINDVFGNQMTFSYFSAPGPLDGVASATQSVGGTETRVVTFTYGTYGALSSMTYNGHTWHYDQQDAGGGYSRLTAVHPPVGVGASYGYGGTGLSGELTSLNTGLGGTVTYTYADAVRRAGTYSTTTRVVTIRSVSGRSVTSGTWNFSYGTGSNQDTTVVTCPCGTTRYTFFGTGVNGTFAAWSAGLLSDVSIEETNGTVLEHRHMDYARSDLISNDPVTGVSGVWSDTAVYRSLLDLVTITRGSETWTIDYTYNVGDGTFNDFGQAAGVTERRSTYQYRTTTRTFRTNFTAYLAPKVATQSVAERYTYGLGGANVLSTFTYETATGFLLGDSRPGTSQTFERTSTGNLAARVDAMGHRTTYSYDWGVATAIDTAHQHSSFVIAPEGLVTSATVSGVTTTYTYDASLRPKSAHPPAVNQITVEYDEIGGSFVRVARDAAQTEYRLDGLGRSVGTSNQVLLKTRIDRDACGRATLISAPYTAGDGSRGTTVAYDALGRPTRVTDAAGKVTTFTYSGARVTRTDANQHTTTYDYLALYGPDDARLNSVTDALGTTTTYTYTTTGNLTSVSGPPGQYGSVTRTWSVDDRGWPQSDTQPESGTTTYVYDGDGKLTTITDVDGNVTTLTYDDDDRLTGRDSPGAVDDLTVTYDANGRVNQLTNGQSQTTYGYANGRLASRTDSINGSTFTSGYQYDSDDNLSQVAYPSGRLVSYRYDAENRLTQVLQQPPGAQSASVFAQNFQYFDNGALWSYVTGTITHTLTYDNVDRLSHLTSGPAGVGLDLTYGYDNVGNVTSISDPRPGANETFAVDPLDRLSLASGPWGAVTWDYWPSGDRKTQNANGSSTSYGYEAINSIATQRLHNTTTGTRTESFAYDDLGRLASDAFGAYTYSPTSRMLTAASASLNLSFAYDAAGERLTKTVNGETTYTFRAPDGRTLSEFDAACTTPTWSRDVIYAGDRLLGAVRAVRTRPIISVSNPTVTAGESSSSVSVTFTLSTSGPLSCPVTASYHTTNSAAKDQDFSEASGTVVFAAGSVNGATQTVTVPIVSDPLNEDNESFFVDLTGSTGADIGSVARATVTITDDDPMPSLTIGGASVQEGNSGTTSAVFAVTLSAASGRDVTVQYATTDGTALAGQDYSATSGTLTIYAGTTSGTIAVPVTGDHLPEPNETFIVQLSSPANATITTGQATGTIVNDDVLTVGLSANRGFPSSAGTAITWTATASGGASPYQYSFRLWESVNGWRTVQAYSTTATFTWAPAHAGTYQMQVLVLDGGSTQSSDGSAQSAQFTITAAPAVTVSAFTPNRGFPVASGTTVTWTASAGGGVAPLQYRFIVLDPSLGWISLQEWGSSNTVSWTPVHPGTYDLQVWVRAAGSTATYDAWLGSGDRVVTAAAPTVISLTADSQTPIAPGTTLTWKAVAAGGTTPLEYEFWLYRPSGGWVITQAYGPASTWTWTADTNAQYVQVWVRAQGSANSYDAYRGTDAFTVTSGPVSAVSLVSNQVAPLATSVPITWTAQATGGTAPLQYRFYLFNNETSTWTIVQDWSASRQYTWTPTSGEFGVHAVQVWVKSTGAPDWEAWTGTGYFVIVP